MAEQENDPAVENSSGGSTVVVKFQTEFQIADYLEPDPLLFEDGHLKKWKHWQKQFSYIKLAPLFTS